MYISHLIGFFHLPRRCEDRLSCYEQLEDQLKKQLSDAEYESNELKKREAELLSFIEKLSANNAHWKSQTCDLQCRVRIECLKEALFFNVFLRHRENSHKYEASQTIIIFMSVDVEIKRIMKVEKFPISYM